MRSKQGMEGGGEEQISQGGMFLAIETRSYGFFFNLVHMYKKLHVIRRKEG